MLLKKSLEREKKIAKILDDIDEKYSIDKVDYTKYKEILEEL